MEMIDVSQFDQIARNQIHRIIQEELERDRPPYPKVFSAEVGERIHKRIDTEVIPAWEERCRNSLTTNQPKNNSNE